MEKPFENCNTATRNKFACLFLRKTVFSCRRLTPFRPSNLTIAYPYGKG